MSDTAQTINWRLEIAGIEQVLSGSCWILEEYSPDHLDACVARLGLTSDFAKEFPATTPSYYGWFIESPLNERQARLLGAVTRALSKAESYGDESFIAALDVSTAPGARLSVELNPPGHVDCGFHTIFAHCPRCKAPTAIEYWKSVDRDRQVSCQTCGYAYAPDETTSDNRMYHFQTFNCLSCHQTISIDRFVEEDKARIDDYILYRFFEAEVRTIKVVKACLERHNIDEADVNGKRLQKIVASGNGTAEDIIVAQHLKNHYFSPSRRMEFLSERLQNTKPYSDDAFVFCPVCNGCLF